MINPERAKAVELAEDLLTELEHNFDLNNLEMDMFYQMVSAFCEEYKEIEWKT